MFWPLHKRQGHKPRPHKKSQEKTSQEIPDIFFQKMKGQIGTQKHKMGNDTQNHKSLDGKGLVEDKNLMIGFDKRIGGIEDQKFSDHIRQDFR
jgi:hypothetical protein